MTYFKEDIIPLLNSAMSKYSGDVSIKMRAGKVSGPDHVRFGVFSMIYNTLSELKCEDALSPLGRDGARRLIYGFNRLTGYAVPDVWGEYCSIDQRQT